jgi:glycerol-3-phosphate dehydrogenase
MARQALRAVQRDLGGLPDTKEKPMLAPVGVEAEQVMAETGLPSARQLRLLARYGAEAVPLFHDASKADMEHIDFTPYTYSELRQAARCEGVLHLDDLLLRRVRLGLLAPQGGIPMLARIRLIVQPELGWDDARWEAEAASYAELWQRSYSLKPRELSHA